MSTEQSPPATTIKPEQLFHPGTTAEQVETMMSVLTQGVVDCMIFATGAFPSLTEGEPDEPNAFARPKPAGLSSWQAARSAELRDAARLTEASARLLTGFAKLRGQFSQDFTIRHNEKRGENKKTRQRNSTVTHRFSVPAREAVSAASVDPKTKADLTRNLAPSPKVSRKTEPKPASGERTNTTTRTPNCAAIWTPYAAPKAAYRTTPTPPRTTTRPPPAIPHPLPPKPEVRMSALRDDSISCPPPLSRRAAQRLRDALGLPRRRRGGQPGNRNRLKHGRYSAAFRRRRAATWRLIADARDLAAHLAVLARAGFRCDAPQSAPALLCPPAPYTGRRCNGRTSWPTSLSSTTTRTYLLRSICFWSRRATMSAPSRTEPPP